MRPSMAQVPHRPDFDGAPTDLGAAELDAAAEDLRDGGVRVAVGSRVVLCTSLDDVKTAQQGQLPRGAVRLDRGRPG